MPPSVPASNFALAKIQPPRQRAGLVARPALEHALGMALQHLPLTLLVAPAGYGKTAALTRQLQVQPPGRLLAWVSADEDDHLPRFLSCLTAALDAHDLPWRVAPDALATLAEGEGGLRLVAGELVNALAAAEVPRGLIVVDDAHRLSDPRVFDLLALVIERLPAHWGIAITSRVEPPLPLARWRAAGDLAEFRQYDLRFSEDEIAALLATQPATPQAAQATPSARELLERTDGWAAGLRLSLSVRPGPAAQDAGSRTQRHLFDYLAAEVLADMPDELRSFLLRCAVLPELTAARCAFVSGLPQAARLLAEVERRGLFVSVVDADELTLRLHDLFREFLEDRLQRDHPDQLPALLCRAAEHEPDLPRAMGYLTRAAAWDQATALLADRAQERLSVGAGAVLDQMLALFPEAELARRPDLHVVRGLAAWPRFDWDTLLVSMRRAAEGYAAAGRSRDAALTRANVCSGLIHAGGLPEAAKELAHLRQLPLDDPATAFVYFTSAWTAFANARTEEVAPLFAAMLDALERMPVPVLWLQFPIHCVFVGLPGMRPLLERFVDGATRVCGDSPTQLRAGVLHVRAWLALSAGQLDEARTLLARADEDCRWLGKPRLVVTENRLAHTLVHALCGNAEASHAVARELIDDIRHHSPLSHRRVHESEVLFVHARAAWILQDAVALRAIDEALARAANPFEWAAAPSNRAMSRAFVALIDGELEEAARLLLPLAGDINRSLFYPATQARLMLADVQQRQGRTDLAAQTLQPWFDEVALSGESGGALLAGPAVLGRLACAPWGAHLSPGQRALLMRLWVMGQPAPVVHPAKPLVGRNAPAYPAQVEGLSERELEVLERIAAGDSNKLIARAFDLSPHTVKRHVANILGKLGVDTRGQAAARWRERAVP